MQQMEYVHGYWFISLGQQKHAFLGSALHLVHEKRKCWIAL